MKPGRITGRKAGDRYELVQYGKVVRTLSLAEAHAPRFLDAIKRNKWEAP